jgi:ATP-dependent phosphofructokinase / diphosphate-dependent phosphofructokinase
LVAQSGGPTAVVNASVAGIIAEALNHDCVEEVYGSLNGVVGLLQEDLVDLAAESQQHIRALRHTPGAALGTCRYKIRKQADLDRVLEVFQAHNIRYFFYIGGSDSQDTATKIAAHAVAQGYELRVIGVPKTFDNDLPATDHCPGYGSVAKYLATTVRELAADHESLGQGDLVSIVEVMGRGAGWIAASAALAKRRDQPHDPPHLIYLPEIPFSQDKCLEDVRRVLKREKFCQIVVAEGLTDADGNYVSADPATDAFGHAQLGGAGDFIKELIEGNLPGVKARLSVPGLMQRSAAHVASKTDADEAFLVGQAAVRAAINGESDKLITLVRGDTDTYSCETGLAPLGDVANNVKKLPREWINEDGVSMNFQFIRYAQPLIQGEVVVPHDNGVPVLARLDKVRIEKTLPAYVA